MRHSVVSIVTCLVLAKSAAAQTLISPEEFLDFAEGRTLTFNLYGTDILVGVEEYLRRDLSVWKHHTGQCVYGRITSDEGRICFLYDNDEDGQPVCWWPFKDGDTLLVRGDGFVGTEIQEVVRISDETLSCPAAPSV